MNWTLLRQNKQYKGVVNIFRALMSPVFTIGLSYCLIHNHHPEVLKQINQLNALVAACMAIGGWGLREYVLRQVAKHSDSPGKVYAPVIAAKLPLMVVGIIALCFFSLTGPLLYFILFVFVLRSINSVFESGLPLHHRNDLFLFLETMLQVVLLLFLLFDWIPNAIWFFATVCFTELLRLVYYFWQFHVLNFFVIDFRGIKELLYSTRFFYVLALVSFLQSKLDFYLIGFYFSPESLNAYQIKVSAMMFAQTAIHAYLHNDSAAYFNDGMNASILKKAVQRITAFFAVCFLPCMIALEYIVFGATDVWWNYVLQILLLTAFSMVLFEFYTYIKRDALRFTILPVVIGLIANLVCCGFLLDRYLITGGLASNVIGTFFVFLGLLWQKKRLNIRAIS